MLAEWRVPVSQESLNIRSTNLRTGSIMTSHSFFRSLLAGLVVFTATACADGETPTNSEPLASQPAVAGEGSTPPSIAEIVVSLASATDDPEFTLLRAALDATGLTSAVAGSDTRTVFAPTDAAFRTLLERYGLALDFGNLSDDERELVTQVLLYHVVPGALLSGDVLGATSLETLQGGTVTTRVTDEGAFIVDVADSSPDARLQAPNLIDIEASNGVIHVIDEVLLPVELASSDEPALSSIAEIVVSLASDPNDPEFTLLLAALDATGLVPAVAGDDDLTVFAPTDAAFQALLHRYDLALDFGDLTDDERELVRQVLLYHVVPGALFSGDVLGASSLITLQGGAVTPTVTAEGAFLVDLADSSPKARLLTPDLIDIEASNGVIHVIDEVLLPLELAEDEPSIAEIVVSLASDPDAPEFTLLLAALEATGLVPAVAGDDDLTVFAPTDAAFQALLHRYDLDLDFGNLSDAERGLLTEVLLYHVVPGALFSGDVLGASSLTTLQGGALTPKVTTEGAFLVDLADSSPDARLQTPDLIDIEASNGVIHVIDEVLLPVELADAEPSIADIVVSRANDSDNPEFRVLLAALEATGLTSAVAGDDALTVFAPTDAAFWAFLHRYQPDLDFGNLTDEGRALLTRVLLYHVVPGALLSGDVLGASSLTTLEGGAVTPKVTTDGAFLVDLADSSPNARLQTPDLIDIEASNGVIHVIDQVLLPVELADDEPELPSIADIVVAQASDPDSPEFTLLLAALDATGLVPAVAGDDALTVFAPTDAAFRALLHRYHLDLDFAHLSEDERALLTQVLLYHVVPGALSSGDVLGASSLTTLQGGAVTPKVTADGAFLVDLADSSPDARLQTPDLIDIEAPNGVVHVIDEVLLPVELAPSDEPPLPSIADIVVAQATDPNNPEFTILLTALEATGLVSAVSGDDALTVFAPTDGAFRALLHRYHLNIDFSHLSDAERELLTQVLLYHVVPGALFSGDVLGADSLTTLQGGLVTPTLNHGQPFLVDLADSSPDARLLAPDLIDIEASNGVVHVIDEVLLPVELAPPGS